MAITMMTATTTMTTTTTITTTPTRTTTPNTTTLMILKVVVVNLIDATTTATHFGGEKRETDTSRT